MYMRAQRDPTTIEDLLSLLVMSKRLCPQEEALEESCEAKADKSTYAF
jgi:hypothetical protein